MYRCRINIKSTTYQCMFRNFISKKSKLIKLFLIAITTLATQYRFRQ